MTLATRPLLRCAWRDAIFLHYEVDPYALRPRVPFELDLRRGKAYVSVVAIRVRGSAAGLIPPQSFLNVRTYVPGGLYVLAGWASNPLGAMLAPRWAGIPYRFGRLTYDREVAEIHGRCTGPSGAFEVRGSIDPRQSYRTPAAGSLEEFLLERHLLFSKARRREYVFRAWHEPWTFADIEPTVEDDRLLRSSGPWYRGARLVAGHHSPGFDRVWMDASRRVTA